MKRLILVAGMACSLTVITALAQTASVNTSSQTKGSVATRPAKVSADAKTESQTSVSRKGNKVEADSNAGSQGNANAGIGPSMMNLDAGTQLKAVLKNTLDSKRAEDGQQFMLKAAQDVKAAGRTVIKKGSTLVGHVVNAQSKAEGEGRSELTLMIDGVQQGGQLIPLQAVFVGMVQQSVQSTLDSDLGSTSPVMSAPRSSGGGGGLLGGGGLVGGVTGTVNNTIGATTQTVGNVAGGVAGAGGTLSNTVNGTVSATGNVTNTATLNQPGQLLFSLSNGVTASTSGSLAGATEFTRSGKDLKLDKGTEFVLAVTGSSRTAASTSGN